MQNFIRPMAGVNLDFDLTFIVQLALVVILMFVLKKWVFGPYLKALDERTLRTETTRKEADEKRAAATERKAEFEESLAAAQARALRAKTDLRAEGVAQKEQTIDAARQAAAESLAASQKTIDSQVQEARSQVSDQVQVLAGELAAKIIGRQVQ